MVKTDVVITADLFYRKMNEYYSTLENMVRVNIHKVTHYNHSYGIQILNNPKFKVPILLDDIPSNILPDIVKDIDYFYAFIEIMRNMFKERSNWEYANDVLMAVGESFMNNNVIILSKNGTVRTVIGNLYDVYDEDSLFSRSIDYAISELCPNLSSTDRQYVLDIAYSGINKERFVH